MGLLVVFAVSECGESSVRLFVGVEYECPRGHRFFLSGPEKIFKAPASGIFKVRLHLQFKLLYTEFSTEAPTLQQKLLKTSSSHKELAQGRLTNCLVVPVAGDRIQSASPRHATIFPLSL